jgi:hypothetical protein
VRGSNQDGECGYGRGHSVMRSRSPSCTRIRRDVNVVGGTVAHPGTGDII